MVNSLLCSDHYRNKLAQIRAHNFNLINDYNSAMSQCISLREKNNLVYEKVETQKEDITQLHKHLNLQQCGVHDYKNTLNVKTMELDSLRAEQNELNIKKFDTSNDTFRNFCDVQLAYKEN
ncbi:hypothetical protein Hanom_Chr13g01222341 [Helianthus anomalus]